MNDPSALAATAFVADLRGTDLDQLEQAVADTLVKLKPGRRSSVAVHREMQRLVLTNAVLTELSPQWPPSALAAVAKRLRPSPMIDEALKKATQIHVEALGRAGVTAPVLELLQSWMEVTIDARVLQRQIDLKRAIDSVRSDVTLPTSMAPATDPTEPLSASGLGQALGGLSDETVRQRERAGELFSVLRPGRKRGREYPAFQAWPGVAGEPLAQVLTALGRVPGTTAYGFFTSVTDLLGGLTPIEAILGRPMSPRALDAQTRALLAAPAEVRLTAVVKAAEAYAALQAA